MSGWKGGQAEEEATPGWIRGLGEGRDPVVEGRGDGQELLMDWVREAREMEEPRVSHTHGGNTEDPEIYMGVNPS